MILLQVDAFIGPSGISGYAPWATWLEILLIVGGATAAAIFISRRKSRR
jgi:hypothetical protein